MLGGEDGKPNPANPTALRSVGLVGGATVGVTAGRRDRSSANLAYPDKLASLAGLKASDVRRPDRVARGRRHDKAVGCAALRATRNAVRHRHTPLLSLALARLRYIELRAASRQPLLLAGPVSQSSAPRTRPMTVSSGARNKRGPSPCWWDLEPPAGSLQPSAAGASRKPQRRPTAAAPPAFDQLEDQPRRVPIERHFSGAPMDLPALLDALLSAAERDPRCVVVAQQAYPRKPARRSLRVEYAAIFAADAM